MSPARKSAASRATGKSRTRRTSASTDRAKVVAPLLRVQVCGDCFHGAVVDVEIAVRVPAGCDEQERPAPRTVQLGLVERHRLAREVGEHRQRVAELPGVDAGEHVCDGIGHG